MKRRELVFMVGWLVIGGGVLMAQSTQRVSVDSNGVGGNDGSYKASMSADGRYVAFESRAMNLVAGGTSNNTEVFVRDWLTGQTTLVSVDSAGSHGNAGSRVPSISADGRYVAFESSASNFYPDDVFLDSDVFVHERETGQTTCVSVDSNGVQGNDSSRNPTISADGRLVAFRSSATNLVSGDTNAADDIFVHDRDTGQTVRVSVSSLEAQSNGTSFDPSISGDGRFVAFRSDASNLVSGDSNTAPDVFVRDVVLGHTTRVSVDSTGTQANGSSTRPRISADGRFVAFESSANNLVLGDTNGAEDVFVHDLGTLVTERVSVDSTGAQGGLDSIVCAISADGRYVVFNSQTASFVPSDTNANFDVFVHDRDTGQTTRASVSSTGVQGNFESNGGSISDNGRYVAFETQATNFDANDTNLRLDVYLRDRFGYDPPSAFCFGDGSLATPCPCAPPNFVPNPSGAPGHGCANSFDLDGGLLSAAGAPVPDSIAFTAEIGPSYLGYGFLVKGNAQDTNGIANGDGVRCVSGALVRFGGHNAGTNGAAAGFWTYPNSAQTTPVSTATAQSPGQSAWYQLFYRNAAGAFCSSGTTNWTSGIKVVWP